MRTRPILLSAVLTVVLAARLASQPAPATEPAVVAPPPAPVATDPAATPPAAPAAMAPAAAPTDAATAPAATPAADAAIQDADKGIATKAKDAAGKETLSVDFPDEDIRTILRNVADLFELNIIIPESLQGKTSIKLRDVTWRQIFQNVLAPVGFTYVEDGNIIKIVSNDSLQQEPVSTEVFVLSYAKASDVKPSIDGLVDGAVGGKILVDARSNSLIITERPSRMNRIRPVLEQLDRATDQVMIETKFIEVTDRDIRDLGVNWASLSAYNVSAGPFTQNYDTANSKTDTVTSGLDTLATANGVTRAVSAVFNADQFKVVLSALQSKNGTKIVSNPTVVTLNNTEASINVGEEFPIPSYSFNEQRGSFEVNGFTYKPIGVILKVTPQVNARGFIKLTLTPEVSQQNGSTTFGGAGGAEIPIIATRKATTQVSLKDGYTMGIGGLITSTALIGANQVPLLGNIPILGYLFKQKSKDITTSNLLIFITAKSLSAEGAAIEQVFDSRQVRDMGVTRDELPGYRDGSDPFAPAPKK
jgi:type IV pilus assembly protein PilQ